MQNYGILNLIKYSKFLFSARCSLSVKVKSVTGDQLGTILQERNSFPSGKAISDTSDSGGISKFDFLLIAGAI